MSESTRVITGTEVRNLPMRLMESEIDHYGRKVMLDKKDESDPAQRFRNAVCEAALKAKGVVE